MSKVLISQQQVIMSLTHNMIVQYHFLGLLRSLHFSASLKIQTLKVTNYSVALLAKKLGSRNRWKFCKENSPWYAQTDSWPWCLLQTLMNTIDETRLTQLTSVKGTTRTFISSISEGVALFVQVYTSFLQPHHSVAFKWRLLFQT